MNSVMAAMATSCRDNSRAAGRRWYALGPAGAVLGAAVAGPSSPRVEGAGVGGGAKTTSVTTGNADVEHSGQCKRAAESMSSKDGTADTREARKARVDT